MMGWILAAWLYAAGTIGFAALGGDGRLNRAVLFFALLWPVLVPWAAVRAFLPERD